MSVTHIISLPLADSLIRWVLNTETYSNKKKKKNEAKISLKLFFLFLFLLFWKPPTRPLNVLISQTLNTPLLNSNNFEHFKTLSSKRNILIQILFSRSSYKIDIDENGFEGIISMALLRVLVSKAWYWILIIVLMWNWKFVDAVVSAEE